MTYISNLLKSKQRYETKFKKLEDYLNNECKVVNEDILYLKLKKKESGLKRAIEFTYRDINEETIDNLIQKMQSRRNENYSQSGNNLGLSRIEEIVDGKTHYFLEDRLKEIEKELDYVNGMGSLEDLDSVRYALARIEKNKYLQNKDEVKKLKEKVEKKLKNYIARNENHYNKKDSQSKRISIGLLKYAAAALIPLAIYLGIPKSDVKPDQIPVKKEIVVKKRIPEKTYYVKTYSDYKAVVYKSNQEMHVLGKHSNGWDVIKKYEVSTGKYKGNKERRGDSKTPEGSFDIIQKQNSSSWLFEGRYAYGPYFFRLGTKWGDIGLHGTNEPELVGRRVSHGCIRMKNNELIEFWNKYGKIGMKIEIKKS